MRQSGVKHNGSAALILSGKLAHELASSAFEGLASHVRSFPPPAARWRPYCTTLPIQPPACHARSCRVLWLRSETREGWRRGVCGAGRGPRAGAGHGGRRPRHHRAGEVPRGTLVCIEGVPMTEGPPGPRLANSSRSRPWSSAVQGRLECALPANSSSSESRSTVFQGGP